VPYIWKILKAFRCTNTLPTAFGLSFIYPTGYTTIDASSKQGLPSWLAVLSWLSLLKVINAFKYFSPRSLVQFLTHYATGLFILKQTTWIAENFIISVQQDQHLLYM